MKPLHGFSRYTSSFAVQQQQQQQQHPAYDMGGGGVSYDDSAVDLYNRRMMVPGAGGVGVQPFNSLSCQTSSGGTLPRPKGLVKPMPVVVPEADEQDAAEIYKTCQNAAGGEKQQALNIKFAKQSR